MQPLPWQRFQPNAGPELALAVPHRRASERSAGIPLLAPLGSAPTELPAGTDFSRAAMHTDGAAYWMVGRDLFLASAGQVLRDVREALGVPDSAAIYSQGMITRAGELARQRSPGVVLPVSSSPADGGRLPTGWMRVFLWLTYSDPPTRLDEVRAPLAVTWPTMNGPEWTDLYGTVEVYRDFDPTLLAQNPFARVTLDPTDVTTDPTYSGEGPARGDVGGSSSSGGGGIGLVIGALVLAAASGGGK